MQTLIKKIAQQINYMFSDPVFNKPKFETVLKNGSFWQQLHANSTRQKQKKKNKRKGNVNLFNPTHIYNLKTNSGKFALKSHINNLMNYSPRDTEKEH